MGLLREVQNEQARAKVGAFGSQGSGKTFTLAALAIGVAKSYHNGAPVAMMDTETGMDYLEKIFKAEGVKFYGHKSGAFADMIPVLKEAEQLGCCAFIMDSVTHTWRELVDSYCAKKAQNFGCARCGKYANNHPTHGCEEFRPREYAMQFQDWKPVKAEWLRWTTSFLNSPMHCFIAGRAGYEYEYQVNEETKKKELVKGDTKMKAEGEFGYEPSLLIEMEARREGTSDAHRGGHFVHVAHVLKDRTMSLNGKEFDFPTLNTYKPGDWKKIFNVFQPHFAFLNIDGTQKAIETNTSQELFDAEGRNEWALKEQEKKVALEEIGATMRLLWPGQSEDQKNLRIRVLEIVWQTRAWSAVESLAIEKLKEGLRILREYEKNQTPENPVEGLKNIKEGKKAGLEGLFEESIRQAKEAKSKNGGAIEPTKRAEIFFLKNGKNFVLSGSTHLIKKNIEAVKGRQDKNSESWTVNEAGFGEIKQLAEKVGIDVVELPF